MAFLHRRPSLGSFIPPVRAAVLQDGDKAIVDRFADLYYRLGQRGYHTNFVSWLGHSTLKCPLDLWIYQELIFRDRPDVIIETGTASGGSAFYLASICELVGKGEVISVDIEPRLGERRPVHRRLTYVVGSSIDPAIIAKIKKKVGNRRRVMVLLDSDHRMPHVLTELRMYQHFVAPGGYLIVEDTNINGHPTYPEFGPGPMEALQEFLKETDAFEVDEACERFLLTMNPRGYLRRKAA